MIVCCGEALVDVLDGDGARSVPGGGPMNAAIAAARLGAPSAFVGRVSHDAAGRLIWDHLQRNGVDLRACERGPEPTARAIVSHAPRLSFRFEGDGTADTALQRADIGVLGAGPHILHGGTLGMFRGPTAAALAELAERHDGLVSLDPNVRPAIIDDRGRWDAFHDRWLRVADLYRASDEDLEWIWPGRSADDIADALLGGHRAGTASARGAPRAGADSPAESKADAAASAAAVIVTRGGRGATVYTPEGQIDVAAPPADVVDTVGAGDAFVGSVLASLWNRLGADRAALAALALGEWRAIAERAAAAAAITCTRPGADPPRLRELDAVQAT